MLNIRVLHEQALSALRALPADYRGQGWEMSVDATMESVIKFLSTLFESNGANAYEFSRLDGTDIRLIGYAIVRTELRQWTDFIAIHDPKEREEFKALIQGLLISPAVVVAMQRYEQQVPGVRLLLLYRQLLDLACKAREPFNGVQLYPLIGLRLYVLMTALYPEPWDSNMVLSGAWGCQLHLDKNGFQAFDDDGHPTELSSLDVPQMVLEYVISESMALKIQDHIAKRPLAR